ncbi:helix-turn-helix transcriptional regulator [Fodinibius sediminis]|uniref:Regulatory protein, luxR family n=1 Tax=Fodinibius sediminis TaxID=1214077 RepID=A0A521BXY1_9BACT|nr:LuxR C-terminal-related transcriptional regulator [Fodinibius sediminis]SMO51431.1 regulatory protein, luxR family [Fodinibius sediminis]
MKIILLHTSLLEGRALSVVLQTRGYHVSLSPYQGPLPFSHSLSADSLFIIDTSLLPQLQESQVDWLCKSNRCIVLLGNLAQLFWFFKFEGPKRGYVCKNDPIRHLYSGIKKLSDESLFLSQMALDLLHKERLMRQQSLFGQTLAQYLTKTELQIMHEVAVGKITKQIAVDRNRSYHTINNHRKNIIEKLRLNGKLRLAQFCYQQKNAIHTLVSLQKNRETIDKLTKNDQ